MKDYGDSATVKDLVQEFLHHASEEVGLLTERSPGQIGFFHLTLEEYLAAVEMARQDTDFRLPKLEKHWANPRWQEVILLTAGELKERYTPAVLDAYLHALLDKESSDPSQAGRAAFLAGRALADLGKGGPTRQIHKDIIKALELTAKDIDSDTNQPSINERVSVSLRASAADTADELGYTPDLYAFVSVSDFAISKYPITNIQYERFLKSENFKNKKLWCDFPKFDENSKNMKETWGEEAWAWLQKELQNKESDIQEDGVLLPRYWRNPRFGINRRAVPVVGISWYEASAYCKWLLQNWEDLDEGKLGLKKPKEIHLPTEAQWAQAAGGDEDQKRFPWDKARATEKTEEILKRANISESGINRTTPVWMYPLGESTQGVMDMAGNVWEWQANFFDKSHRYQGLRGGSWYDDEDNARVSFRNGFHPNYWDYDIGFRVALLPSG